MASLSFYTILGTFSILNTLVDATCERGESDSDYCSDSSWSMWYIWMSVVMTTLCCCGVLGFYCRHARSRNNANARQGHMFYPYPQNGVINEPGIYYPQSGPAVPVEPPAYDALAVSPTVAPSVVQPGIGIQTVGVVDSKPPAYSEIFGPTSARRK